MTDDTTKVDNPDVGKPIGSVDTPPVDPPKTDSAPVVKDPLEKLPEPHTAGGFHSEPERGGRG